MRSARSARSIQREHLTYLNSLSAVDGASQDAPAFVMLPWEKTNSKCFKKLIRTPVRPLDQLLDQLKKADR
jgi:hypothetical protein